MRSSNVLRAGWTVLVLACGSTSEATTTSGASERSTEVAPASGERAEPPTEPPAEPAAAPEPAAAEAVDTSAFHGTWEQADDPTGRITTDPLYAGSRLELREDGHYSFALGGGGSMGPMQGTWRRTGGSTDELRYVVTFARGSTDERVMRLRREGDRVVGLEVGDEATGLTFYTGAPSAP
jgi:hypothetical protein